MVLEIQGKMSENPDVAQGSTSISAVSTVPYESKEAAADEDAPVCWICLESSEDLITPCKCPRTVHARCLARWQLQSAGTSRESYCDFCRQRLPDWKEALTPDTSQLAPAVMNVNYGGRTYSFEVRSGPDGYAAFTRSIRRAFDLPEGSELNITFTCDEPRLDPGALLTLQGAGAYDAAVHCASISAARRQSALGAASEPGTAPGSVPPSRGEQGAGGPAAGTRSARSRHRGRWATEDDEGPARASGGRPSGSRSPPSPPRPSSRGARADGHRREAPPSPLDAPSRAAAGQEAPATPASLAPPSPPASSAASSPVSSPAAADAARAAALDSPTRRPGSAQRRFAGLGRRLRAALSELVV